MTEDFRLAPLFSNEEPAEWSLFPLGKPLPCECFDGTKPDLTARLFLQAALQRVTGVIFHQLHPFLKVASELQIHCGWQEMKGLKNPCLWKRNPGAKTQEKLFSITCSIYIFLTLALTTQLLGFIPTHQGSLVLPTFSKKAALWPGAWLTSLIWEMLFYIISYLHPAPAENPFCFAPWNLIFVDSPIFF